MNIDERDFFDRSDDWILERLPNMQMRSPDVDIAFVDANAVRVFPRRMPTLLAAGYAWYLALVAGRSRLAEKIQTANAVAAHAHMRNRQLVFKHGGAELHISVAAVFKHCSLVQIQQWAPNVWRKMAQPAHLPLFTVDVLLAIQDEALLAALFERMPMLWLPTSSVVLVSPRAWIQQTAAYRVAVRCHRLLLPQ